MKYYFSKVMTTDFDTAIDKVTTELKKEQFGVLTQIDMQAALKEKIGADIRKYKILGSCNPPFAHKALLAEGHIGLMLPCNVVVQENEDKTITISAIDPVASMMAIENESLSCVASEVREKLKKVIDNL